MDRAGVEPARTPTFPSHSQQVRSLRLRAVWPAPSWGHKRSVVLGRRSPSVGPRSLAPVARHTAPDSSAFTAGTVQGRWNRTDLNRRLPRLQRGAVPLGYCSLSEFHGRPDARFPVVFAWRVVHGSAAWLLSQACWMGRDSTYPHTFLSWQLSPAVGGPFHASMDSEGFEPPNGRFGGVPVWPLPTSPKRRPGVTRIHPEGGYRRSVRAFSFGAEFPHAPDSYSRSTVLGPSVWMYAAIGLKPSG